MFTLLALMACNGSGDDTFTATSDTQVETGDSQSWGTLYNDIATALQSDLGSNSAAGVSMAILSGDEIVFSAVFGSAHPTEEQPLTTDTLFQIGSTTKMFTSAALLQLVESGLLDLSTTLAEGYPNSEFALNESWNDSITAQHLLTHQGGFYDYFDWSASSDDGDLAEWHETVFFPYLWLMAEPGSFWNYSNPNFNLAGLIAEYQLETPYPDLMSENVFGPLGMDRTYQRKSDANADGDYALGFGYYITALGETKEGPVLMIDVPDLASARPAGSGTWSTPTQMMEMARFLLGGDGGIVSDETRDAMTSSQVPIESTINWGYGYGLFVGPGVYLSEGYQELNILNHGGNTLSYSSEFWVLPDHDLAFSILISGYGADLSHTVATTLETLLDLGDLEQAPAISFDSSRLDDHVGLYRDQYNVGDMIISRYEDTLFIEMPLLDELGLAVTSELQTVTDTIFYVEIDGAWYDLTFIGEPGDASGWAANRAFVGTRVAASVGQPPPTPPTPHNKLSRAAVEMRLRSAALPALPLYLPAPK
jgi:CubicO group peptidase (beta-lactamase class C family)